MISKKQILRTGLLVATISASTFQVGAQNAFTSTLNPLLGGVFSGGQSTTPTMVPLQGAVQGAQILGAASNAATFINAQPIQIQPFTQTGFQAAPLNYSGTVAGAANTGFTSTNTIQNIPPISSGFTTAAPQQAVATQFIPQQQAVSYQYVQPQIQTQQVQFQPAQVQQFMAQPQQQAVRYQYVQQVAAPAPAAVTTRFAAPASASAATYYQNYSTSFRPTLPQPTVQTFTIQNQAQQGLMANANNATAAPANIVSYQNCVAGCGQSSSQNQSFISHCVRSCQDLIVNPAPNSLNQANWGTQMVQPGQSLINGQVRR